MVDLILKQMERARELAQALAYDFQTDKLSVYNL